MLAYVGRIHNLKDLKALSGRSGGISHTQENREEAGGVRGFRVSGFESMVQGSGFRTVGFRILAGSCADVDLLEGSGLG